MVDSLFSMVDKQGDKEIDVLEFADLCDILRLEHAISKGEVDASHSKLGGFGRLVQRTVSKNSNLRRNPDGIETINENWDFTTWLVTVVHSRWLRRFVATLILVDTIILACVHEGMDPDVMRAIRIADGVFVIILVLDDLFKIYVLSFATYWHDIWNRFSLVVVLISIVLIAFFPLIGLYLHKRLLMDHTAIRVQAIAGSIRAVKLLEFSASVQWYFTFLLKCYPVMFDFVVFFVGSAYSYGVIGLEVFHDTQEFDDVKNMVLTCLRILSMEGWHILMFDVMSKQSTGLRVFTVIYFISFVFLVDVVILSQFTAVMYEMFMIEKSGIKTEKVDYKTMIQTKFVRPMKSRPWRHKYLEKNPSEQGDRLMAFFAKETLKHRSTKGGQALELQRAFTKARAVRESRNDVRHS
eukprot:c2456_g1_i3.p1 GENE.c2456_g1_i3~~c2456_g1_i3.p1  ORF type:complete len:409 (+),score=87.90 c2456_g1_i3:1151-2377(+)